MTLTTALSKHLFFPLWEIKDGASRARYLRELSASQWLDEASLRRRQWERVRNVVRYARQHCPYYTKCIVDAEVDDNLRDWSDFRRIPMLGKEAIRENASELLSDEFGEGERVEARTGGSTGVALTVYFDDRCQQMRNAAAMRSDRWAGWDIGMKTAAVWGNPPVADTLKKKLRSLLLDRVIYLDTMDINDDSVRRFAARWHREKPRMIFGHSHSIYVLALYVRRLGLEGIRPRGIVATSMMLLEPERRIIEDVFRCKVSDRYGCEEVGLIAAECEQHAGLHLNVDHLVVEFVREDGSEAAPGEEGEIVVTDLINLAMPLIRYRVGDIGLPSRRSCACGRGLPLMERVVGRRADFLKRDDGSLVAGVSLIERTLTRVPGIEQMQLVQDRIDHLTVNVVAGVRFDVASERALCVELREVFGDGMAIAVRQVSALDRTRNGKYRFAICNA